MHCLSNKPITATKLTSLLTSDLQVASTVRNNNNKIILYSKNENDVYMYKHAPDQISLQRPPLLLPLDFLAIWCISVICRDLECKIFLVNIIVCLLHVWMLQAECRVWNMNNSWCVYTVKDSLVVGLCREIVFTD